MGPTVRIVFLTFAAASHASAEQLAAFDGASASSAYLGSGDFWPSSSDFGRLVVLEQLGEPRRREACVLDRYVERSEESARY